MTPTERADLVTAAFTTQLTLPEGVAGQTNADKFATKLANRGEASWCIAVGVGPVPVYVQVDVAFTPSGVSATIQVDSDARMTAYTARKLAATLTELGGLVDCLENIG